MLYNIDVLEEHILRRTYLKFKLMTSIIGGCKKIDFGFSQPFSGPP